MKRTMAFWTGMAAAVCATSLWQDIEGQTGMIELVQHHWTTGWYTVPVALLGLLGCAVYYLAASKADGDGK